MRRSCWSRAPTKNFKRIWNTPSRILTLLVDQATSSKRLLASRSWSRGWSRDVRAWWQVVARGSKHALFTSSFERLDVFFVCFLVIEGFHSAAHYVRSVV